MPGADEQSEANSAAELRIFHRKLLALFVIGTNEAFNETVPWPFLPFMVLEFGYDQESLGYYVGFLVSSFFLAQFASSFIWGKLSDRFGRRPTILWGAMGTVGCILLFGASKNLATAMTARITAGLLNGNIGITKTYMAEVTDSTTRIKGFTALQVAWGCGSIIGPAIGGFLCRPAEQLSPLFGNSALFKEFPYLLPCIFNAAVGLLAFVLGWAYLKETDAFLQMRLRKQGSTRGLVGSSTAPVRVKYVKLEVQPVTTSDAVPVDELNSPSEGHGASSPSGASESDSALSPTMANSNQREAADADGDTDGGATEVIELATVPLTDPDNNDASDAHGVGEQLHSSDGAAAGAVVEHHSGEGGNQSVNNAKAVSTWQMLRDPPIWWSIMCYCWLACIWICFNQTLSVFCETPVADGGLGFVERQIGIMLAISGVSLVFFQMLVFPRLSRRFGFVSVHRIFVVVAGIFFLFWPSTSDVAAASSSAGVLWAYLTVMMILHGTSSSSAFTAINICIQNSCKPEDIASVNGFSQTLAALVRTIGPSLGGSIWSLTSTLTFPMHTYTLHLIMFGMAMAGVVMSVKLDKSLLDVPFRERRHAVAADATTPA